MKEIIMNTSLSWLHRVLLPSVVAFFSCYATQTPIVFILVWIGQQLKDVFYLHINVMEQKLADCHLADWGRHLLYVPERI